MSTHHAPELAPALAWLGTDAPITLDRLRGRVAILHFWTAGSAPCWQLLDSLREVAARFRERPVQLIGVHTGRLPAERDPDFARRAAARLGVNHPVLVDDGALWDAYKIRGWPTLVVVDALGRIAWTKPGDPGPDAIAENVSKLLAGHGRQGDLVAGGPLVPTSRRPVPPGLVAAAGLAVSDDGRVAIADTPHHRVLLGRADDTSVQVEATFGAGHAGYLDGPAAIAAFTHPAGVRFTPEGDGLVVADAGNHALRHVDLAAGVVSTLAGTGDVERSPWRCADEHLLADMVGLRTPWDAVVMADGRAIVAMAGSHQLWRFTPAPSRMVAFAGTGDMECTDGELETARFAQPMGLALDEDAAVLWVADAEANALRRVDLASGQVETAAGGGLFAAGFRDGSGPEALLQHPRGVAVHAGAVWIADTYDGALRRFDPATGELTTAARDLGLPCAVAAGAGALWVLDADGGRLLRVDPATGEARPVAVEGLTAPPWRDTRVRRPGRGLGQVVEARMKHTLAVPVGELGTTAQIRWVLDDDRLQHVDGATWRLLDAGGGVRATGQWPDAPEAEIELTRGSDLETVVLQTHVCAPAAGFCRPIRSKVTLRPEPRPGAPFVVRHYVPIPWTDPLE